jgi:multisubunit Na+/H+ antiporter MnhF subunit
MKESVIFWLAEWVIFMVLWLLLVGEFAGMEISHRYLGRSGAVDRLVGLQTASIIVILMLLAQGFHRLILHDLALIVALLSFGGVWCSRVFWSGGYDDDRNVAY